MGSRSRINYREACLGELKRYKRMRVIHPKADPLEWWRKKKEAFPNVAAQARKFLAVQATSAPTERIFSRAQRIISQLRCSLDPAMASKLLYAGENLEWYRQQLAQMDELQTPVALAAAAVEAAQQQEEKAEED